MEHQHQLKCLTQQENGYIGYCAGCQSYNVAYKNMLFILSDQEFSLFRQAIADRVGMRPFYTMHGKEWLLKTPMPKYHLMLNDEEIEELCQMMSDAELLKEVDTILQTSAENNRQEN
ncbi:DUF6686 family protein [Spirosoma oryzicola]|uniref:DUF6686 family protein n=1 Tax=Spirosoma oryzicola TaxID=2898794 RepID=UPI001E3E8B9B|nr:DUF6686 family protein [Spirosoma oryzicola]UHG90450.1 hypothetical protein LQ777_19625 [Spirosoma oryzicola]